jgi:hypothetical protein
MPQIQAGKYSRSQENPEMSPTNLSVGSIFKTISEQKLGFTFGDPDRPSDESLACILPILRVTTHNRQYVTMPETKEVLIRDTGSINKINMKNNSKENVFVRSGTIFEGKGTQSRALTRSSVLFPGQEVALDVRCVHASHGIHAGSEFKYGGVTPLSVDSAFYTAGYTGSDQRTMWTAVEQETRAMCLLFGGQSYIPRPSVSLGDPSTGIGSDNLKKSFDAFANNFDGVLSKARLHDNQAGLALITQHGCKTIEIFDVPISWESLHKDAVKRMGTELLRGKDDASVFDYKPENAIKAVQKVLALPFASNLIYEHKPSNGEPHVKIFGVTANKFVGEIVELAGQVIHMVVLEID